MRVLFVLGTAGLGGHSRSAIEIGKSLIERGVNVYLAAGDYGGGSIISESGIPFYLLHTGLKKGYKMSLKTLYDINRVMYKIKPDVIHAFDFPGLVLCYKYAKKNNKKLVYTICGGPPPKEIIKMSPIAVFSKELYHDLVKNKKIPRENVFLNGARIPLDIKKYSREKIDEFKKNLNIANDCKVILTIARIDRWKLPSIMRCIDMIELLSSKNTSFAYIIIGSKVDKNAVGLLEQRIEEINSRLGNILIHLTDEHSSNASKVIPIADIAMGMGRFACESMSLGIPTAVVGKYGYAGLADERNLPRIAEYNFSGRDMVEDTNQKEDGVNEIMRILNCRDVAGEKGEVARRWIEEHMDVKKGAEFYYNLYRTTKFEYPSDNIMFREKLLFLANGTCSQFLPKRLLAKMKDNGLYYSITGLNKSKVENV